MVRLFRNTLENIQLYVGSLTSAPSPALGRGETNSAWVFDARKLSSLCSVSSIIPSRSILRLELQQAALKLFHSIHEPVIAMR